MTIKPALALIAYALLMLAAGFLVEQRSGLYFLPIVLACVPLYIVVDAINKEAKK